MKNFEKNKKFLVILRLVKIIMIIHISDIARYHVGHLMNSKISFYDKIKDR